MASSVLATSMCEYAVLRVIFPGSDQHGELAEEAVKAVPKDPAEENVSRVQKCKRPKSS